MRTTFAFVLLIGFGLVGTYYYFTRLAGEAPANYRTVMVTRGELLSTISATGTLEPEEVVDVGAQVAGLINALGRDPNDPSKSVDYRSMVQEGTILARIDDSLYQAQVAQARASLQRSHADLARLEALVAQTEADWKRAKSLIATKAIAETDYDAAVANYHVAKANVLVGQSQIAQDTAVLKLAETNLGYTVIKSPVKGEIIDRRVNIGQTVVAALNAPSLFLIAKDLGRMQVWASVNEADIGRIHKGQQVSFTVDASPRETFCGKVAQLRLNATMTQNVVTYTVVVETDNSSRKLLPYQTANVQFEIARHEGVLMVPNAALRWKPRSGQITPELREAARKGADEGSGAEESRAGARRKGEAATRAPGSSKVGSATPAGKAKSSRGADREERGRVWAKDGNYVRPIDVRTVTTDGTNTEITGTDVQEDLEVVTGENVVADDNTDAATPFLPKIFKSKTR